MFSNVWMPIGRSRFSAIQTVYYGPFITVNANDTSPTRQPVALSSLQCGNVGQQKTARWDIPASILLIFPCLRAKIKGMDYTKLKEESLKIAVRDDFFSKYKYTQLGNIDFVIAKHVMDEYAQALFDEFDDDEVKSVLWAEAKQGTTHDIYESFVQLILTIGKERTFEKYLPPKYIGAFDAEKFAFIEYHSIQEVFYQNDFNWNVTPSNHETKEFKQLHELCENLLRENSILFHI